MKTIKTPERILVKVIKNPDDKWPEVGKTYEVCNHISFKWEGNQPFFEREPGLYGIPLANCIIIGPTPPEYTMDELYNKIGHIFTIKK